MSALPRTTEYRYNADGKLVELTLRNEATGDEVTRWEYGVTKADGEIASNELLRAKIYPDSDDERDENGWDGVYDRVEYRYNVAGEMIRQKDQNATVHEYGYDKLGRLVADRVTELGEGIDDTVMAIGRSYNVKGQLEKVTTYEDAELEEVRDQVQFSYDGFGQVTKDYQEHEGAVNVSTSQKVSYGYESGGEESNIARLVQIGYSKLVDYNYGTAGSIDDLTDRVRTIESGGVGVARYTKRGVNATVRVEYLYPGVELTYIKEEGEPDGDAGDQYTGLDRFNRIEDIRWINRSGETPYDVDRYQYGFDRAGNRVWRRNAVLANQGWDEAYGYDGLYQLTGLERGNLNINRTAVGATPAWEEAFNYDPAGNWQRYATNVGGVANLIQSRQHNRANEITFIDGANLQVGYDRAGNMTRMPKVGHWETAQKNTWDAWNRLVRVEEGETTIGEYAYDGLTRRIWKKTHEGEELVTRHGYFSTQWQLLEERLDPAESSADRSFIWGLRYIDDLILRDCPTYTGNERIYVSHDQWHVTALLAEEGGDALQRFAYSAFGMPMVIGGGEPAYGWETLYGAYRWDRETGLYCVRYRYLHPDLGRWLSRDFLRQIIVSNDGDYEYCGNRPQSSVDVLGLAPSDGLTRKCKFVVKDDYSELDFTVNKVEIHHVPWSEALASVWDFSGWKMVVTTICFDVKGTIKVQCIKRCDCFRDNGEYHKTEETPLITLKVYIDYKNHCIDLPFGLSPHLLITAAKGLELTGKGERIFDEYLRRRSQADKVCDKILNFLLK